MSKRSGGDTAEFWLGDRGEGKITDFDGRPRACRIVGRVRVSGGDGTQLLVVHVDPPLPISSDRAVEEVVLAPRWAGTDLERLPTGVGHDEPAYLPVYIYEILDVEAVSRGFIEPTALRHEWYGEVARRPDLLPATREERFDRDYQLLERFVAREGHSDVPLSHREEGVNLGLWVANLRFEHANLGLRRDWSGRLEQLPGWRWLPGSDFYLLERYARREKTTRIALDHVEEGRPLGRWVADLRRLHEEGRLAGDWEARLEAIPFWEW